MADGSVTIEVTLTKEQLEKGIKSIKSDLNSLSKVNTGTALKSIGSSLDGLGQSMTKTGKIITGVTTGMIAGLGTAIGRFDTLKNYPKVLENLGFSAEEAEQSIKELSEGIDGLPTALDDAASGVQRLVAKNSNIKKSTKYFLAMNDAIVAGNAPAEQQASAIEQLTQAYSKGKPDMMEWRTLMMAMPGQLKQVAVAMGYLNTDQLYEALKKGTISMDDFMDKIVELDEKGGNGFLSFEEQAKNSTNSIGTALKNVSNRFKKGMASILGSLDEMAGNTKFGSIAGMINSFSTSVKKFLDKIGTAVKENRAVQEFMSKLSQTLEKLKTNIDNMKPETLDKIITAVVKLAEVGPMLIILGKGFSLLGKLTYLAGSGVTAIKTLSGAFKIFNGTATGGTVAMNALSKAFTFLTGPAGITIGIILAVIAVLVVLYKKCESFRNAVNKAFEGIKNTALKAWEKIKPSLEKLWDALQNLLKALKPIGEFLSKTLIPILNVLIGVLGWLIEKVINIVAVIVNIVIGVVTTIIEILTGIVTFFTQTLPNGIGKFFNEILPNFINSAIDWFKNLPYNIGKFIGECIGHMINFGVSMWKWVTTELPKIINNIVEWFKQLPGRIWTWLTNTVNKISEWIRNMKNKITEGVPRLVDNIVEWFSSLPDRMWQIGINIVNGLWNGIKSGWGWLKEQVNNLAKGLVDGVKSTLKIQSPSRVFRDEVGKFMALGIGEGFEQSIKSVYKDMKSAVDFETQKLSANLSTTANVGKVINANITLEQGNMIMDGEKVGRIVTPAVTKTLRGAGAY